MPLKTSTTINNFGPALKTLLVAQTALTNVAVTDGPPAPGTFDGLEWIAILDVEFEQTARALNVTNRPRRETYTQAMLISVIQKSRSDHATPSARAWVLFNAVHDAFRDNPTLTGYFASDGQIIATQIEGGTFRKTVTADASVREASIEFRIRVDARI